MRRGLVARKVDGRRLFAWQPGAVHPAVKRLSPAAAHQVKTTLPPDQPPEKNLKQKVKALDPEQGPAQFQKSGAASKGGWF
jgi:hypothetical protein